MGKLLDEFNSIKSPIKKQSLMEEFNALPEPDVSTMDKVVSGAKSAYGAFEDYEKALVVPHVLRQGAQEAFKRIDAPLKSMYAGLAPKTIKEKGVGTSILDTLKASSKSIITGEAPSIPETLEERYDIPQAEGIPGTLQGLAETIALSPSTYALPILAKGMSPKTPKIPTDKLSSLKTGIKAKRGIKTDIVKNPAKSSKLLNKVEDLSFTEQRTGTKLADIPYKIFENENKFESFKNAIMSNVDDISLRAKKLNVSQSQLTDIVEGNLKIPTAVLKTHPELGKLVQDVKNVFPGLRQHIIRKGYKVGEKAQYAPRRLKAGLDPRKKTISDAYFKGATTPKKHIPGFAKHRSLKKPYPETFYEKDFNKLATKYLNETAYADKMSILPRIRQASAELRGNGHLEDAMRLERYFADSSKLGESEASRLIISDIIKKDSGSFNDIIRAVGLHESAKGREIYSKITESMYKAWIGTNPRTMLKQGLQTRLVGPAEIGKKWINSGIHTTRKPSLEMKHLWDLNKDSMIGDKGIRILEGMGPKASTAGKFKKAIDIAGEYGMKKFSGRHVTNLKHVFYGTYKKTLSEGKDKIDDVLEGLLPAQANMVRNAYNTGGLKAAATIHAKIRALRVNYIYSAADRPEILSGPLGKYIPFTTWSRNQWMRYTGDIANKDPGTIAKRLMYPLYYLLLFEAGTGYSIPGSLPASSIPNVFDLGIAPAVTGVGQKLGRGDIPGTIKEAADVTSLGALANRLKNTAKKGPMEGFLGLKKSKVFPGVVQMGMGLLDKYLKDNKPKKGSLLEEWEALGKEKE